MPATVADPNRSLDSEQISPATIAHHTMYEKAPNLHQSHICQWGAQPYLVGPLSRLVGKPPLSPWVSTNVLPLTQGGNYTNSAISLTEIFDRIFFMCVNSVGFEVQIEKNGDRGIIVFTATLTSLPGSRLRFFYRDANSVPTSTPSYSSIIRLYAQNTVFKIVREESVKVYLHMRNGNVQQNPPCVESCVTKEISISPQLSPTMVDPDANSVLLGPVLTSR